MHGGCIIGCVMTRYRNHHKSIGAITLASTLFLAPASSYADCDTLTVAAAQIPHFSESTEKGIFISLIREAAARANLEIDISVMPKKRALARFLRGNANTLLPHSSAGRKLNAYKSDPIFAKMDLAFVRKGETVPQSIDDLAGKTVGLTAQYSYPKHLTSRDDIQFVRQAQNDEENIRMLAAGRYDVAIIEKASGSRAVEKSEKDNVTFSSMHPITELQVWVMFSNTECGRHLQQEVNKAFKDMKEDKSWGQIFQKPKAKVDS